MRVLFVNPSPEPSGTPHYGLAVLGTLLKQHGHDARVADYQCSGKIPPLNGILRTFRPQVVGISVTSAMYPLANQAIDTIRAWDPAVPIVLGGPHASCYTGDLIQDGRIDYVVVGEAESAIVDLVEHAGRQSHVQVMHPPLPDVQGLPVPDYRIFYDFANIRFFPLVTSRGCPYQCSFCAVHLTNSRKWRPRQPEACLEELLVLRSQFPKVQSVIIWDDNFSLNLERGKQFLRQYLATWLPYPLRPAHMRADRIDDELVRLLKATGCPEIQLGAEHGDPKIFKTINKGETLDDIRRAGAIVNRQGLQLVLSFIIGLPGDSLKKTFASARLARALKARCDWNILVPYRGTRVYQYFKSQGRLDETRISKTWMPAGGEQAPSADSPDFDAGQRVEAKRLAEIFSEQVALTGQLRFVFARAVRYGFLGELLVLLLLKLRRVIGSRWHRLKSALQFSGGL